MGQPEPVPVIIYSSEGLVILNTNLVSLPYPQGSKFSDFSLISDFFTWILKEKKKKKS